MFWYFTLYIGAIRVETKEEEAAENDTRTVTVTSKLNKWSTNKNSVPFKPTFKKIIITSYIPNLSSTISATPVTHFKIIFMAA